MRLLCLLCQRVLSERVKDEAIGDDCIERRNGGIKARLEEATAFNVTSVPCKPSRQVPVVIVSSIRPPHRLRLHMHKGLNEEQHPPIYR